MLDILGPGVWFFIFAIGSMVGSFLNVCIYRMPLEQSIVWPGSHCPSCKKSIPWYLNIPLFSYAFLRGRCRFCGCRIPIRYFLVELLTGLLFIFLFNRYNASFDFIFYAVFLCGLLVATFVDIQHRIIPDEISIGGAAAGLLLSAVRAVMFSEPSSRWYPVVDSFLGILIGGGIIFLIGYLFDLVYFKMLKKPPIQGETESMGGGDVKLLAMIGAFLGWKSALITFFLAPFLGIAVGLVNLLAKKDHTIPYGPFLSLAAIAALLYGDRIIAAFFYNPFGAY